MAIHIKTLLGMGDAGKIPFRDGSRGTAADAAHKRRMQELYDALQQQNAKEAQMALQQGSIMQAYDVAPYDGGGGAGGSGYYGGPTSKAAPQGQRSPVENPSFRRQMVGMRLHVGEGEGEVLPFQFFETHIANETVHVFIVTEKGDPVTLTDEVGLFPSDTFITQLRLLL